MKLLFVGISLDKEFERALLANGFHVDKLKTPSGKSADSYDIVALKLKTKASLKELEKLRKRFPSAWLCALVPKTWLTSGDLYNALLDSPHRDEVWFETLWPHTFWLSVQHMLHTTKLKKEMESLQKAHGDLSTSAKKLVDQIEKDVDLASNIQRSLLPKNAPDIPGVSIAVKFVPATGGGGDYYDIFEFGDRRRFGVLLADSKTHGMAAALLSTLLKVRLEELKDRFPDSHSFVDYISREIQRFHAADLAPLSLLYGILDRHRLHFRYTSSGDITPVLWRNGGAVLIPASINPALGDLTPYTFKEQEIALKPGDLLLLHTDGIGADAVYDVLKAQKDGLDLMDIRNELMAVIGRGPKLKDDITIIQLSINERTLYVANAP